MLVAIVVIVIVIVIVLVVVVGGVILLKRHVSSLPEQALIQRLGECAESSWLGTRQLREVLKPPPNGRQLLEMRNPEPRPVGLRAHKRSQEFALVGIERRRQFAAHPLASLK